jgi:cytoskeletal protein CcmA (bactofilin family)
MLSARRPAGPTPHATRVVYCSSCGHRFEISRKAFSATCPGCTQPMRFKDLTLSKTIEGRIDTMGHIEIAPTSHMTGELACGELTSQGKFDGSATVYGAVALSKKSRFVGELRGKSLTVEAGAELRGKASIGPQAASNDDATAMPKPPRRSRVRIHHDD